MVDGKKNPEDEECVTISKLTTKKFLCAGPWFLSLWEGQPLEVTADLDSPEETDSVKDVDDGDGEDDLTFLRSLDPKEWKQQDHYAVLGLSKLRHRATDEDIRRAYRKRVLQHHPDKRKGAGEEIRPDDDYFTCITKAWETLGNPVCRRSYDSVDPTFDDTLPSASDQSKNNFFEVYGRAFELNSRWSTKQPVPKLGTADSPREQVDRFYAFWYNFESWREYSYLDEEEKEKGECREERRWIEKQNKVERAKRKKEEMTRIRNLVDAAYALDPRIMKFKEEDKERKMAAKRARQEAVRARLEEEEKRVQAAAEEARRIKEQQEAEEKAKQKALRAEKEAQKKALKQQRTALRKLVKTKDYFAKGDEETLRHMASLEKICECLQANELEELIKRVEAVGRDAYVAAIEDVERRIEEERQALMEASKRQGSSTVEGKAKGGNAPWTPEDLQLLIKAVNIFPAGTSQRWEVVANFMNQHRMEDSAVRTAKEVLSKAKDLQNTDYTQNILKVTANENAYKNAQSSLEVAAAASERFDTPAEQQGVWTSNEQQLLEQALKTYPASTPERWDKIAECVPSRSKKECMRRFKELAEMVKAKKAAQAAAQKSK